MRKVLKIFFFILEKYYEENLNKAGSFIRFAKNNNNGKRRICFVICG